MVENTPQAVPIAAPESSPSAGGFRTAGEAPLLPTEDAGLPSAAAVPPAGTPHARTLGMMSYGLGIVLSVLSYLWATTASQSARTPLASLGGFQPVPFYANWGIRGILFLLAMLLMTLVGWLVAGRGTQLFSAGCLVQSDTLGKIIGLLTFCGGIAMVVVVFMNVAHYFGTEPSLVPTPPPVGAVPPDYAAWALNGLFQILQLALMALNGSLVAGRGVQLFLASFSNRERAIPGVV